MYLSFEGSTEELKEVLTAANILGLPELLEPLDEPGQEVRLADIDRLQDLNNQHCEEINRLTTLNKGLSQANLELRHSLEVEQSRLAEAKKDLESRPKIVEKLESEWDHPEAAKGFCIVGWDAGDDVPAVYAAGVTVPYFRYHVILPMDPDS